MAVSERRFAELVDAATSHRARITKVAVSGFGFVLTLKARRLRHDVRARYDPSTDSWTATDPYRGGTLPSVNNEIWRSMPKSNLPPGQD
jgi:hypothetical protein